jgi:methylenetetrahydrofolate dehydrogenase (NADP+) / methenyltetrahydrofolate cyclohydrolase
MTARLIDGEAIAAEIRLELRPRVEYLRQRGCIPRLAMILAGDNPASITYLQAKSRACAEVGIDCETLRLPGDVCAERLTETIHLLNADPSTHAILVQQPLPPQIDTSSVVQAVVPAKDVDGLHPLNLGLVLAGRPHFVPCTAKAVQELLVRSGIETAGRHIVIVGRSSLVGRPLAALLIGNGPGGEATVTICHRRTADLPSITGQADILVTAAGYPGLVSDEMVKVGAHVIDVGINRVADPTRRRGYRLTGDVDFASASERAASITPVPGGVGPMTVAMLIANTVHAAEEHCSDGLDWNAPNLVGLQSW